MHLLKHIVRKQKHDCTFVNNNNTSTTTNNTSTINTSVKQTKPRKISDEINKKYSSLLKKLFEKENTLDKYKLSTEVKALLNIRIHLLLEYYTINKAISTSHDNDLKTNSNTNDFEYIDSFSEINSFYK
ncbi:Hypothetical protein EHI5A_190070 [Entamoeba histolytica KU27]|uniref:Uncharacterized protein n=2 Tax=Entamoeba histolytica TaxID=5759 RepID=M2RLT3_ENTHI|nr:Hypothetical protein EHI5A_190070 [Entamoeba histolytica KU27]ENY63648.1 hypothetical protein EHI7A_167070 [Entamoeba histolytica HM-1:IMSS-A]